MIDYKDIISGNTNVFGLIGNPISHTFSPTIHNLLARDLKDDLIYVPFCIENSKNLAEAINGAYYLNIKGLNVTLPYKKDIIKYLSDIDEKAEMIGAVNTLKYNENGYIGYNTDIIGIINTFKYNNYDVKGRKAVILGAGGSACAAVFALAEMEINEIFIVNRTLEKAESLAKHFRKYYNINIETITYKDLSTICNIDFIIQTTSVGLIETDTPICDESIFKNIPLIFDFIYSPWETMFLKQGKRFGCNIINGFDMLVYQAIESYQIWQEKILSEEYITESVSKLKKVYKSSIDK